MSEPTTQTTPPTTPPTTPAAPVAPPADPPAKKYTDDDMNAIVLKRQGEATAALLKDLGVESTGKLKDDLKALKEIQDKGKTDAEKATAAAKEATDKLTVAEARALAAETRADALAAGIDPKKIDRAVKIIATYDGDTPAKKVAAFLAENPEFKAGAAPVEFGAKGRNDSVDEKAKIAAELDKAFGIKPKKA